MPKIIKRRLDDMWRKPYGEWGNSCEPTAQQIQTAIDEKRFETRPFQKDEQIIYQECWKNAGGDVKKFCDLVTKYHAERVAYFVENGLGDPIKLKEDGKEIDEGSHRYLAAKHMKEVTIDVEVNDDPVP
jgi:hypothetical protein